MRAYEFIGSWNGWRANRNFLFVLVVYVSAALSASKYWNIAINIHLYSKAFLLFGSGVTFILFAFISAGVMLERPPRLYPALRDRLLANRLPERLTIGLPVMLIFPIFFSLFTSIKGGITRIVPFYADKILENSDRMIHGGLDTWRILHPIFGIYFITFIISLLYNLWFIIMFIILFCVTFSIEDRKIRSQYLITYVFIWAFLGNLAAALGSSVGPAFVASFYNDPTFLPLMDYLRETDKIYPVWALDSQSKLLSDAGLDGPRWGSGISAFPSMHVAVATLNAIYLWRFGALLRWFGVAFLIAIQLGSVHLGWHYAVDGYASIVATPLIWMLGGWLSDFRRPAGVNSAENVSPA